ncbi:CATRA system-associated protein [Saccharothrix lopnurensis]|uniref:CATRA system-associated protein n=1 Tax=Saccharothrix lopnurensis TaxID=1670621 RepID=A0ABW1P5Y6_9PSEU
MVRSEAITEALDVLTDIPRWKLHRRSWAEVSVSLRDLATAFRADDTRAVVAATVALELLSPDMSPNLGEEEIVGPPDRVREQRAEILDSITAEPGDGPRTSR